MGAACNGNNECTAAGAGDGKRGATSAAAQGTASAEAIECAAAGGGTGTSTSAADGNIVYQVLLEGESGDEHPEGMAAMVVRRSRATSEQREEWARYRARAHCEEKGRGGADGSADGRWQAHVWVLRCGVCGLLVDWRSAANRAARRGRDTFEPGDGCSGPGEACGGKNYRPGRSARAQRSMRAGLDDGNRLLVEWPGSRHAKSWIRAGDGGDDGAGA